MANVYKARIDIKNVTPNFKPVFVQYDHAVLEIELVDSGRIYNLTNVNRVEFTHVRKDGLVIIQPGEIVADDKKQFIRYEYQGSEMELWGIVKTSFAIFDTNNKKVSTHAFNVSIVKDLREDLFEPAEPNFGLLQTLIADVENAKKAGGIKGDRGEVGPRGERGEQGEQGEQGEPFKYADFTPTQLEALRDDITNSTITPKKTTFFNEKQAIHIEFRFGYVISNGAGTNAPGDSNVTLTNIPVNPNETYYFSNIDQIAYYKSDGAFKNIELPRGGSHIKTMAADVHFIKISAKDVANYVFAKSNRPLTYEEANTELLNTEYIPSLPYTKIHELEKGVLDSISNKKGVACYGDSLTEGSGSTNAGVSSYPIQLRGLINANNSGYLVVNRGVGGEATRNIMVRQGAYADFVDPFTIPPTTTAVTITKSNPSGRNGIKNGVNPVTIKGVKGNLSLSGNVFYFTRLESGNAVIIDRPTPIIRASSVEDKDKIQIIYMGQNGGYNDDIDELISQYKRMIDFLGHNKYLIIGLTTGTASSRMTLESEFDNTFGINYINMRKYIVDYGLLDNNLEPTEDDNSAIAVGSIPPRLLADTVHFNNNGYYSVAKAVYARGQDLGYWK